MTRTEREQLLARVRNEMGRWTQDDFRDDVLLVTNECERLEWALTITERERDEARTEAERLRAARAAREQDLSLAMEVVHRGEVEIARLRTALDAIPCQACNGDGVISWDADAGGNHVEYSAGCIKCDGTGKNPDAQAALRGAP